MLGAEVMPPRTLVDLMLDAVSELQHRLARFSAREWTLLAAAAHPEQEARTALLVEVTELANVVGRGRLLDHMLSRLEADPRDLDRRMGAADRDAAADVLQAAVTALLMSDVIGEASFERLLRPLVTTGSHQPLLTAP
jgi:chromosomal replication initiation ATPase DnaA